MKINKVKCIKEVVMEEDDDYCNPFIVGKEYDIEQCEDLYYSINEFGDDHCIYEIDEQEVIDFFHEHFIITDGDGVLSPTNEAYDRAMSIL